MRAARRRAGSVHFGRLAAARSGVPLIGISRRLSAATPRPRAERLTTLFVSGGRGDAAHVAPEDARAAMTEVTYVAVSRA
jgi:hypothetical protein